MTLELVEKHLTNTAYGFPRGARRRVKPIALACIHITGNSRTAANPDPRKGALDEWAYANRAGSMGPSAHYYIARDGWVIEAYEPGGFAGWSNGDVNNPARTDPGIADVLAFRGRGLNVNEAYAAEIECIGHTGAGFPINAAQKQACAEIIARCAKVTGLPISRRTVHGHWQINGVDRQGCPVPLARHDKFMDGVIAMAREILNPTPVPVPPDPEPVPVPEPPDPEKEALERALAEATA